MGNTPSCPSSLCQGQDGRPHNVRVTGTSLCEPESLSHRLSPWACASPLGTVGASDTSSLMVFMVFVYRSREAPTLFVGSVWEGHSGMESVYLQQSLAPVSRCDTNPHSPPAFLCRIQLPFTCPRLGGQPCPEPGCARPSVWV